MGIFDKIKNTFFYDPDEENSVKKEVIKVEIPAPVKEKKEEKEEFENKTTETFQNNEINKEIKKDNNVFFEDDDFVNIDKTLTRDFDKTKPIKRVDSFKNDYDFKETKNSFSNYSNYNSKNKEKSLDDLVANREEKKFIPTPVISPVYGVLDKNYHKEDIINKDDKTFKNSEELTIDDLRDKAFGSLEEDLEKTMTNTKSRVAKNEKKEIVLNDLELEMKQTAEAIDLLDKKYNEFDEIKSDDYSPQQLEQLLKNDLDENSEEKKVNTKDDELFDLIDSLYERSDK